MECAKCGQMPLFSEGWKGDYHEHYSCGNCSNCCTCYDCKECGHSAKLDKCTCEPCEVCDNIPFNCECITCTGCKDKTESTCENCEQCDSCCECAFCSSCDTKYNAEKKCDNCEKCRDCCECSYCENCESKHDNDNHCYDCDNCQSCCSCSEGAGILKEWVGGSQSSIREREQKGRCSELADLMDEHAQVYGKLWRGIGTDYLEGKALTGGIYEFDGSYGSSSSHSTAESFSSNAIIEIIGAKALYINDVLNHNEYSGEEEHIIPIGSKFYVDSITTEPKHAYSNYNRKVYRLVSIDTIQPCVPLVGPAFKHQLQTWEGIACA